MRDAVADILVHLTAAHVDVERMVPALAKAANATGVQGNLLGGQDAHGVYAFDGALRIGIERPQAVDQVVVQVDPERQFGAHGKDVHQRTAYGVFAAFGHRPDIAVSGPLQPRALGLDGEAAARFEHQGLRFDKGGRRQPLHQRLHRRHQYAALFSRQCVERRKPFGDDVLVRRKVVVRQRFPVGKGERCVRAGYEKIDLPTRPVGILGVPRDVEQEMVGPGEEARGDKARTAAEQVLPVVCRTWRWNVDVRRVHGRRGQGWRAYSSCYGSRPKPEMRRRPGTSSPRGMATVVCLEAMAARS